MGAQSLPEQPSEAANSGPETSQMDGEIQLYLRRLSKREPITKLKALQASCLTPILVTRNWANMQLHKHQKHAALCLQAWLKSSSGLQSHSLHSLTSMEDDPSVPAANLPE
jgi:hypothetical protein